MLETKSYTLTLKNAPHESKFLLSDTEENSIEEERPFEEDQEEEGHRTNSSCYFACVGALMAVGSGLCFSICSLIVKYLTNIDPFELSTIRFVGILLPVAIIVICVNENPLGPQEKRCMLLLRAICGAMSLMLQFYAIQHMPLADASVIIFSAPVFVAISARIFLKEYFGLFNVVMILFTVLGVICITKPPFIFGSNVYQVGFTDETLRGVIAALIGTVFAANVYVLLRHLKVVHYSVVMLTFAVIAIIMSATATFFFGTISDELSVKDYLLIATLAVFSFGGQILLTKSLQFEQAGPIAIYRTSDIVFAFIWQSIFFKEVPNAYSVCGAIIISSCVILTGLRKWLMASPNKFKRWKCFYWC